MRIPPLTRMTIMPSNPTAACPAKLVQSLLVDHMVDTIEGGIELNHYNTLICISNHMGRTYDHQQLLQSDEPVAR